jgi:hypothetical protein
LARELAELKGRSREQELVLSGMEMNRISAEWQGKGSGALR